MMETQWPVRLFNRSVLKQRKFKEITDLLGNTDTLHCLDIGADNGVISYLLRKRGGHWKSADMEDQAVESIRELVGTDVFKLNGRGTPFKDDEFDRVVVVDYLEHIHEDQEFVRELFRVIKPGGVLILNVPNIKNSLLRKFRIALGQTDEKHGHVRPGYTIKDLESLLAGRFSVKEYKTYSKFFSELVDTLMVFAINILKRGAEPTKKGTVVTGGDMKRFQKVFMAYSSVYPIVRLLSRLDALMAFTDGYTLIVRSKIIKDRAAP